jgi:hypothetical protein
MGPGNKHLKFMGKCMPRVGLHKFLPKLPGICEDLIIFKDPIEF